MPQVDRRGLMKLGALGLTGLATPALGQARGFTHNVASGEPGPTQMLLWTRYVGSGDARLGWEVAEDQTFRTTVASGEVLASPERDWCAKALATGLAPGRWYYYRFVAPSGEVSAIGRTRTLPVGKVASFKLAVFSCSNFGFGWFNAYAHAAEAGNFDLAVHLGDYYYEYKRGEYPSSRQAHPDRPMPLDEATTLAGYRERMAIYRADPDLQRLHQCVPMVLMWDDHEVANDTWKDGAENHDASEGDWQVRRAASERAWREWLPVSDEYWAAYEIGDLATLFRLESRHVARDRAFDIVAMLRDAAPADIPGILAQFRAGAWRDPARHLLGAEQEAWLAAALKTSKRAGKRWQVLAQQVVMGELALPGIAAATLPVAANVGTKTTVGALDAAARAGLPFNMDAWDGYPAARTRLYRSALDAQAEMLVLSGDSHNAWAFDHALDGQRIGAEFGVHAVTSPGAEGYLPWVTADRLAPALIERNPSLKWCDTAQRGYLALELTRQAATGEWRFMASVRQKGTALASTKRMTVLAGQRQFTRS
jgi:alkaline phosphatase D